MGAKEKETYVRDAKAFGRSWDRSLHGPDSGGKVLMCVNQCYCLGPIPGDRCLWPEGLGRLSSLSKVPKAMFVKPQIPPGAWHSEWLRCACGIYRKEVGNRVVSLIKKLNNNTMKTKDMNPKVNFKAGRERTSIDQPLAFAVHCCIWKFCHSSKSKCILCFIKVEL